MRSISSAWVIVITGGGRKAWENMRTAAGAVIPKQFKGPGNIVRPIALRNSGSLLKSSASATNSAAPSVLSRKHGLHRQTRSAQ